MSNFKIDIGNWIEYWADGSVDLPNDTRQEHVWAATKSGTGTEGVVVSTNSKAPSGYVLGILSGSGETLHYAHATGTAPFAQSANSTQGYTIEASLKVLTNITLGQDIRWADNEFHEIFYLTTAYVRLGYGQTTYAMDTTDDFHKYRIAVKGSEIKIYVDDILRITDVMDSAATALNAPYVQFGDGNTLNGGSIRWAYVKYNTTGAYAPQEDWYFSKIDLQDKRKVKASSIIRSHSSIIQEGKMSPARIKLSGTIAGTCWGSFRDTVRSLKKILYNGNQRIYMDDERYMVGLHDNFSLAPITQDYAKFSASFQCRYPFWQNLWAEYFSTAPVVGATFYVQNASDIEIPVKVIFTGAAATTIVNDVRLKNITALQDAKFTATLFPTQEVIVDRGFDSYNTYKVLAGSNAHASYNSSFGSYEGDIFTLVPGENAFVQLGTAVGTLELYWREAYLL